MDPVAQVIIGWLAFGSTHTALSHPPVRDRLVARLGDWGFVVLYSLVAFTTFVPLVWSFFAHRIASPIPLPTLVAVPGIWWLTMLIMFVALNLVVIGFASPNPVSNLTSRFGGGAVGVLRITRHPAFMGVALFGLAHLLVNHTPIDRAFFGGLVVYPVLGCAHQDWRRRQAGGAALEPFFAATSFLPFVAIAQGRNRFVPGELRPVLLLVTAALYLAIFFYHDRLFA